MNDRERTLAVLNYEPYDRLPVVHFGFWKETLEKWAEEGHITEEQAKSWGDGNPTDAVVSEMLGFDFNYYSAYHPHTGLKPPFESKTVKELEDGSKHVVNPDGVVVLEKTGAVGIPPEIEHLLKDRASWEEHFVHRLEFDEDRILKAKVRVNDEMVPFDEGGLDFLKGDTRTYYYGLHCGSLFGRVRDMVGVTGATYIYADDEALFDEMINVSADLCFACVQRALESGAKFDFGHFWEDICFKNGPLISPYVFEEKVGPHYKRITDLLASYGITVVSLDCDGMIDALIPTWLANGVNTMFPIEVGTWNASIGPWREQYGKGIRGVGGTDKKVFAHGPAAIRAEVERLKPLVELGGYIPCPDHRLPPDAEWDNVRRYCDIMHETFG